MDSDIEQSMSSQIDTSGDETSNSESCPDPDGESSILEGIEQADGVCVRLNRLIKQGKIDTKSILYKHFNDLILSIDDQFHMWDREVVEFYNSITYLGGKATANFIRAGQI